MELKDRLILEDFRKSRDDFVKIGDIVSNDLHEMAHTSSLNVMGIEHRVKTEKSLAGKLIKNGDYYQQLSDLTDLIGARVICYFSDEVDKFGKLVEQKYDIDWEHSSDKRELIRADSFGYLSLHYIASLKRDEGYPERYCNIKFEIQIRTNLQHTWAQINHDLGYKSDFGVPRAVTRQFSRLAGLLELADDEFVRTRDLMISYTEEIRDKIIHDNASDVPIDNVSLKEYVLHNGKMREYLNELCGIAGAELSDISPESYIAPLNFLGKSTIGDISLMLAENKELALKLAENTLAAAELDILSSNVGLRFICRAELLSKGYSEDKIIEFLLFSSPKRERAERNAKMLLKQYKNIINGGN